METKHIDFLCKVTEMVAPSGTENEVINLWNSQISTLVDDMILTKMGNSIAVKKGESDQKIMLVAHADEIGFIITYIDAQGFLYFDEIGGIDTNILPGSRVLIKGISGFVEGVIGVKPIHLQERGANRADLNPEDLWIDINVASKSEALEKVQLGSVATYFPKSTLHGNRFVGKSLDNRSSLAVLLAIAQNIQNKSLKNSVYFVASTQEELRGRGAQTAAFELNPDICIVLDVTHATDYPSMSPVRDGDIKLGEGAVIAVGPNMNPDISQRLIAVAKDKSINYQVEVLARPTGTDANAIQITQSGIDTGLVSIPCRYMHSPVEVVDIRDMEAVSQLLTEFLLTI